MIYIGTILKIVEPLVELLLTKSVHCIFDVCVTVPIYLVVTLG